MIETRSLSHAKTFSVIHGCRSNSAAFDKLQIPASSDFAYVQRSPDSTWLIVSALFGTCLYCLVALFVTISATPETHQRQKVLQFFRTRCMRQHVHQVLCSRYLLQYHTSRSNQVLKPLDSRICVIHMRPTPRRLEERVCRTAVHLDFNHVVSQTCKHQHLLS